MVYVVVFAVVVFVSGCVILGMLGWKTFQRIKALGYVVAESSERIAAAAAGLDEIAAASERRANTP